MRSIRASLMVYFLFLLIGAIGSVAVIVYRLTENTLQAEEGKRREMLEIHYKDLSRHEATKFDDALEEQVQRLSQETSIRIPFTTNRWHNVLSAFGPASGAAAGNGHLTSQLWLAMARGYGGYPQFSLIHPEFVIPDNVRLRVTEDSTEFWQIDTSWKQSLRSESLGELEMPFDLDQFSKASPGAMAFDNLELEPGLNVRRVVVRQPAFRGTGFARPTSRGGRGPTAANLGKENRSTSAAGTPGEPGSGLPSSPERMPAEAPRGVVRSYVYFAYAAETAKRDKALEALQDKLQKEKEQLRQESATTLAELRNRLLLVGVVTCTLTIFGGLFLVRSSLSPLQRLSEAVSRISEKDVKLQVHDRRLPEELQPIVGRLQQSLERLHGALAREKQAAADISHELRTPLAALLTTTEVALRKPRSQDEYREVIQDCRTSCQQMSRLVERLLALSRLDAGVDRLRVQEVDASELVEKCAGMVRPLAESRGLTLRVHRNGPVFASVDADKLREILTNLLSNAIEYNTPKGSVEVTVDQENGHLSLEVRDSGIGMSPESVGHIFERFYRADPARQAESMHAGLGLAIVKGYLDLMGGTISVHSSLGQGSTFCVQLPVRPHTANGI